MGLLLNRETGTFGEVFLIHTQIVFTERFAQCFAHALRAQLHG